MKIFIWLQSQESQLYNKCLFCSIKSVYIPRSPFCWRVLFSNPLAQRRSKHADEYILIVMVKFVETCQTMFIINPHVVNCLNNQYLNQTIAYSIERKNNEGRAHGHARKPVLTEYLSPLTERSPSFFRKQA